MVVECPVVVVVVVVVIVVFLLPLFLAAYMSTLLCSHPIGRFTRLARLSIPYWLVT